MKTSRSGSSRTSITVAASRGVTTGRSHGARGNTDDRPRRKSTGAPTSTFRPERGADEVRTRVVSRLGRRAARAARARSGRPRCRGAHGCPGRSRGTARCTEHSRQIDFAFVSRASRSSLRSLAVGGKNSVDAGPRQAARSCQVSLTVWMPTVGPPLRPRPPLSTAEPTPGSNGPQECCLCRSGRIFCTSAPDGRDAGPGGRAPEGGAERGQGAGTPIPRFVRS